MKTRLTLLSAGLFPETLPPCFNSKDCKRAFRGLVSKLEKSTYQNGRWTEYIRYNGTKHDGNRRFFATPNIISYFYISSFIWENWNSFEKNYSLSKFSIGKPKIMDEGEERAVKVPSLSELSKHTSENIQYAPFVLKADIAQCFPSIYTHSISWAAHGISQSKSDIKTQSKKNFFNALDYFVRNAQQGHTRGVLIGPDGYRLISEFILSKIDSELETLVGDKIVGAVRHVDDYYIGLRTEHDAQSVLSHLRNILATYELNLNDNKTKIYSSLEPINDLWAQRLRRHLSELRHDCDYTNLEWFISEALDMSKQVGSDSPIKMLLRRLDEEDQCNSDEWVFIEKNLLRIVQKHPHALDYACLLVAKRHALKKSIDVVGWSAVARVIIQKGVALNHHHETVWMMWLLIVCGIQLSSDLLDDLEKSDNGHIRALLIQAYLDGKTARKPKINLGSSLATENANWLVNLVARSQGFSAASFSGTYKDEFEHLAKKKIKLINLDEHMNKHSKSGVRAISRVRYGYDDEEEDDLDYFDDEPF